MKPTVMSGLVAAGLLTKKDRILCCGGNSDDALLWLQRQRFRAEAAAPETFVSLRRNSGGRLFDVGVVEADTREAGERDMVDRMLRECHGALKPGGRLLVCRETSDLFGGVGTDNLPATLGALFPRDLVAALPDAPGNDSGAVEVVVVKKSGVYRPRLPVRFIDNAVAFVAACENLQRESVIGLDVETTLVEPRILCTVQLATETTVYLIDALPLKDLRPLKGLMENDGVLKIIHNAAFEEKVLGQYGISIKNVYDTLIESRKRHKKKVDGGHNLGEVCIRELGVYLDKSLQASDWTRRPLTQEQRDYAAADAEVLIRLHQLFVPPKPPENMELF